MSGDFIIRAVGPDEASVLITFRERMLRELDCTDQARLDELARDAPVPRRLRFAEQ